MDFNIWFKQYQIKSIINFLLSFDIIIRPSTERELSMEEFIMYKMQFLQDALFTLTDIHIPVTIYSKEGSIRFFINLSEFTSNMTYDELVTLSEKIEKRMPDLPQEYVIT